MADRPRDKPGFQPKTRHYKKLPSGKRCDEPVERYEKRYACDAPGKEAKKDHSVRNAIRFAQARGRSRSNSTAPDNLTTMSKKSAFQAGFRDMLKCMGADDMFVKEAARSLEGYTPPQDYPVSGPAGIAAAVMVPQLQMQLSQLTDMGDQILNEEEMTKRRRAQMMSRRGY